MTPDNYSFDVGPMGAIGEQGSLMLRINRNCPWNRCLFCHAYKGRKFEYRRADEIKRDIDTVRFLADKLGKADTGLGGEIGYYVAMQAMWYGNTPRSIEIAGTIP